ncbi:MAG TPA: FHA domain-containing protein, partial [Anaerolineales bacterium]|nr:FHA domain-containing protein [Anaerolineales bacterium]
LMDPDGRTRTTEMAALVTERARQWPMDETAVPAGALAVYVEGAFDPAYVDSKGELVLGRKVGTTSESLVDLGPWGGYHMGLSRRHASVRRTKQGYEVLDLGSVNGTWLNDERLIPHKAYPLKSGSYLRLGRMRLYVLHRPAARTK